MIAVVDGEPEGRLEIGAAAAAGMGRELMYDDFPPRTHEAHRRSEPGKTRAHDMHRSARHQMMPWRKTAQRNWSLDARISPRGGVQPRATSLSRSA